MLHPTIHLTDHGSENWALRTERDARGDSTPSDGGNFEETFFKKGLAR